VPGSRGFSRGPPNRADDVFVGRVFHLLRRVESETVKVKFVYPVATVRDEEFAHRARVRPIKVDRFAPIIFFVALGEVMVGKHANVISVGAEMVVNDVKNDGQA